MSISGENKSEDECENRSLGKTLFRSPKPKDFEEWSLDLSESSFEIRKSDFVGSSLKVKSNRFRNHDLAVVPEKRNFRSQYCTANWNQEFL